MITNEQIEAVYAAERIAVESGVDVNNMDEVRYKVKRAGLQAYDESKWNEYNQFDESTWPEDGVLVIVEFQTGYVDMEKRTVYGTWMFCNAPLNSGVVVRWQNMPLPLAASKKEVVADEVCFDV